MFFERRINFLKNILIKPTKQQWSKGAHVTPNSVVGPSYLSN
jgi:hypothetical protein